MTGFAADDANAIAKRMNEIAKETQERVTGAPVHIQHDSATGETLEYIGDYAKGWPMTTAADYDPA